MTIGITKLQCGYCQRVFCGFHERHNMASCPCGKSGFDWDQHYIRWMGELKTIDEFEPPWFEDEDEYHSALLGFLLDSDEKYELIKRDELLLVVKL